MLHVSFLVEQLRRNGKYISECNSGNVVGTRLCSSGVKMMKAFTRRLRHYLVLEGTIIVSMTLKVEKRVETISCLDKCLGALEEVLPPLRLRSLLVPINDGLVRDAVLVVQNLCTK